MTQLLIICMGISSEYVLTPLANYFKEKGQECLEVDLAEKSLSIEEWRELGKRKNIFITSGHPDMNKLRAEFCTVQLAKWLPHIISPLDLIEILKPIKSVYIPHDLMTPLIADEWKYIDQFDLLLSPNRHYPLYDDLTRVEHTGWIKYQQQSNYVFHGFEPRKKLILLSMFEHLRWHYGLEGLYNYLRPLLDKDTSIKFPLWSDVEIAEEYFRKHGPAQVCKAEWNSIDLMQQHEIIISNGASSVLLESVYLGKRTICLESTEGTHEPFYQRRYLGYLKELEFLPYFDPANAENINDYLKRNPPKHNPAAIKLEPFQFEQAYQLIMENVS